MSTDTSVRMKRGAEWWWKDAYNYTGEHPTDSAALGYLKIVMNIAAADGELHEKEREWVLGVASTAGISDEVIKQLEAYNPVTDLDANNIFNDLDKPYIQSSRLVLIFYAFQAASADGKLHPKELEAICNVGKKLGLTEEQIREVHALSDAEDKMREKRASVLFPKSVATLMKDYKEQFS